MNDEAGCTGTVATSNLGPLRGYRRKYISNKYLLLTYS